MNTRDRITAFEKLGKYISAIDEETLSALVRRAGNENPWFTRASTQTAFKGILKYLEADALKKWVAGYDLQKISPKTVAIVMAGNIPLAGFHDFLAVILSGHRAQVKLSSKDSVLLPYLAARLVEIEPSLAEQIQFQDQLRGFDAVIATGSDNSARYFNYYFGKYPHIIRKNRTSCAVLTGSESTPELEALGHDVFSYFGLGCRNVSKIFLPKGFNPLTILSSWESFRQVVDHYKYHNNYDYQKSILLVNGVPFHDSGFVLLQESDKLVSPVSVVYFEYYDDEGSLGLKLSAQHEKIQCVVGHSSPDSIPFGKAQFPEVWDYADRVDTLSFLAGLS